MEKLEKGFGRETSEKSLKIEIPPKNKLVVHCSSSVCQVTFRQIPPNYSLDNLTASEIYFHHIICLHNYVCLDTCDDNY